MLNQAELQEVIDNWSFFNQKPAKSIQRSISLPKHLTNDFVLVIQGVRRGGKSTLMDQLPEHYGLNFKHCYYCNFEDPRLMNHLTHELLTAIVKLAREKISANEPCYFFFDEIQHVLGWEKWLHTQLARPKQNFFVVTGSNSVLLSGELGSALTGRHITIELFPFSFEEYQRLRPKGTLKEYLTIGGFPRALTYDTPITLLQDYFNDIILRDVLQRVNARSAEGIRQVVKWAFDTCGSQLSYRKIAAVTGLSVDTVQHYLEACEQAYILFSCPYFSYSEKKRLSQHKKFYPIDPGLRNAVTATSSPDFGKALEQLVYLRLRQSCERVYYWESPTNNEVAFVTINGKKITPYQVTWEGIKPRHEKALDAFYEAFPHAEEAVIITQENAVSWI